MFENSIIIDFVIEDDEHYSLARIASAKTVEVVGIQKKYFPVQSRATARHSLISGKSGSSPTLNHIFFVFLLLPTTFADFTLSFALLMGSPIFTLL
jgi:hypothetical protein